MRATTLRVCCSLKWLYRLTIVPTLRHLLQALRKLLQALRHLIRPLLRLRRGLR